MLTSAPLGPEQVSTAEVEAAGLVVASAEAAPAVVDAAVDAVMAIARTDTHRTDTHRTDILLHRVQVAVLTCVAQDACRNRAADITTTMVCMHILAQTTLHILVMVTAPRTRSIANRCDPQGTLRSWSIVRWLNLQHLHDGSMSGEGERSWKHMLV